ncbi:WcaG Nucleoside-diphosphate-sugar epimerases [Candidatus Methylopumilus universalis]
MKNKIIRKILITGADGFIGKNLKIHLSELKDIEIFTFIRSDNFLDLKKIISEVDFIFHLAGTNRPENTSDFYLVNKNLTEALCNHIVLVYKETKRRIPILFSSSSQAELNNDYGLSKLAAEEAIQCLLREYEIPVYIYRLPNVFGKWSKPNYNSVVSTFCHNIANEEPIFISDPKIKLTLVYIDDVVRQFIQCIHSAYSPSKEGFFSILPQYEIALGDLADQIKSFKSSRNNLMTDTVGHGLSRALYATYLSYIPPKDFAYSLKENKDIRGTFVEMVKTPNCGQFSYFTAHPEQVRGRHYHHTKNEKFLVVRGSARFRFRHIMTNQNFELYTSDEKPEVVQSIPGWVHDITNIGVNDMIVMLWANESFDTKLPDTYSSFIPENKKENE